MKRVGMLCVAIAATLTIACGSDNGAPSSPTSPSPSNPSPPAPAPSNGGLTAPNNLRIVTIAGTQVTLAWDSTGAPEYLILVGTSQSSSNALTTNTTQTTYSWTVSPGSYYARVQSKNGTATSGSSNEVSFTISQ